MPADAPAKRVDVLDIEALSKLADENGVVKVCRCWKSKTFPLCDGSHVAHNAATGDNVGPWVLKGLKPNPKKPRANNYGVPSTVPSDKPVKRVDITNIDEVSTFSPDTLMLSFCMLPPLLS